MKMRVGRNLCLLVLGLVAFACVRAQDASKVEPLAFEVATVKPVDPKGIHSIELRVYPGGRLVIHGHSLQTMVSEAFNSSQVVSGEKWMTERLFDVEGKPSDELRQHISGGEFAWFGIHDAQVRSMLQALLIERFHLKYHVERQPGTVYVLKRSGGALRLKEVETKLYTKADDGSVAPSGAYPTGDFGIVSGTPLSFYQTSMAQLADHLSGEQHAPVIDETGLQGFYDFKSKTVVTDEDFKSGTLAQLFSEALGDMGLKLVKTQGTVEKLVIDSAEMPVAN
jgi:uncharacterized protein (TIGR03435 family)